MEAYTYITSTVVMTLIHKQAPQLHNLIVAALYVLYVVSGETKFSVLGVHLSCRSKIQRTDRVTCIMLASVTPDAPPNMSVMALRSQLILLNSESTPENKTGFV